MAYTAETEAMVALAAHRMHTVLHAALRESGVTRNDYLEAVRRSDTDEELESRVAELPGVLLSARAGDLASRLPREFDPVFWVDFKRNLMRPSAVCDFTDFGRTEIDESFTFRFEAAPALRLEQPPSVPSTVIREGTVGCRACHTVLLRNAYLAPRSSGPRWEDAAEELLAASLPNLQAAIVQDQRKLSRDRLLTTYAFAFACGAYWSMMISFGRLLKTGLAVNVPLIGELRPGTRDIVFEPSAELLRLLKANVPVA